MATGCAGDPAPFVPVTSATTGGSGGSGGGAVNVGKVLFEDLFEDLDQSCGGCHKIGGQSNTPFMGDDPGTVDSAYEAITSWPDVVVRNPDTKSVLIQWPASGSHTAGPTSKQLEDKLIAWLNEEAKSVAETPNDVPTIEPFKPIVPGFNAVYLGELGADYAGMAVTFQATALTDNSLSLDNIEVHTTAQKGIKFDHPLFTVYPASSTDGEPDPVDSFSNVSQEIPPGEKQPLGPGSVILTNWETGGKLSIAFETVSVIDPLGGGGGAGGGMMGGPCDALGSFSMNAAPQLEQRCEGCHGGNVTDATNAVDMSGLGGDVSNACGQILNRVNLNNPNQSQIFITTDPNGNAAHPFKFGGNAGQFDTFRQAVTTWINAESNN
jgi:mono/diheme cytochrome c family protein